jgi:superfamily II DNA or RNA helicase
MMENRDSTRTAISDSQRLLLHQLRLLEWLDSQSKPQALSDAESAAKAEIDHAAPLPGKWSFTQGVTLYKWQEECVEKWFAANYRGTVKVVTGGGKTLLALAIAERLQNTLDPDLRVAIVVPTVVLMHQWYDEILEHGNLPARAIGRLGGGYSEEFGDDQRILITVLASAHKQLAGLVKKADLGSHLLLVADECHRSGAPEMSKVFETPRSGNLGLSATPERDEDEATDTDTAYEGSLLGKELGPIIYEFTLAQALELGVVPPFSIYHYGLPLNPEERQVYERLSRAISDNQSDLRNYAPEGKSSGAGFFQWLHKTASKGGEVGSLAARLMSDISRRQELIHSMAARGDAVESLLRREFSINPNTRAILFHESIAEVMRLFVRLHQAGFAAIAEHSLLPNSVREDGLNLFRRGTAKVIVSAKSLIEGFNVPAVDVGIIVASSSSVRQRVQSLGRMLRRHRGPGGEEKTSSIHILYAADTADESIYEKLDWDRTTGVERNLYFAWDLATDPVSHEGPPRFALPGETEVDTTALAEGDEYLGRYEGAEYTSDSRGNIADGEGRYATATAELVAAIQRVKGSAGRFRVTPRKQYVLVRVPRGNEWTTLYVTQLREPLRFDTPTAPSEGATLDPAGWVQQASPGQPYPFSDVPITTEGLKFKRTRGGVLARKMPGREVYALTSGRASDPAKGADAESLLATVKDLVQKGVPVSQLEVNELRHVLYRQGGQLFFVCALHSGLEFPD